MDAPQALRICEILRAAREELGDDQILESDQRDSSTAEVYHSGTLEELVFQPDPANTMSSGMPVAE